MKVEYTSSEKKRIFDLTQAVNGRLEITNKNGDVVNVVGYSFSLLTPGANVEYTLTHNLGYIPTNLICLPDAAAVTYASRKALWTPTQAFLKTSLAAVNLVGFIF